jgi:hypothetical protein
MDAIRTLYGTTIPGERTRRDRNFLDDHGDPGSGLAREGDRQAVAVARTGARGAGRRGIAMMSASHLPCIFCKRRCDNRSVEHIFPESLGGKEWSCLPPGIVCDACNNYFGTKVEPRALDSFPFLPFRVLLGIPTKKRRASKLEVLQGTVFGSSSAGRVELDPRDEEVAAGVRTGRITQMRLIAQPTEPVAVCRFLLKMGLEVLAGDDGMLAREARFDATRTFARAPKRGSGWWFLLHTDHERLFPHFVRGVSIDEWRDGIVLEVVQESGAEIFHLEMLGEHMFTPLEPHVLPGPPEDFPAPAYQLVRVTV